MQAAISKKRHILIPKYPGKNTINKKLINDIRKQTTMTTDDNELWSSQKNYEYDVTNMIIKWVGDC